MPARTGHTTYVPGRGATTVKTKKSGKQVKTFQGKPSAAPAGTTVVPEATTATAPTVEVKPSGKVLTRNYRRQKTAEAQLRRQKRSSQRVQKIVSIAKSHAQKPAAPKLPPIKAYTPPKLPVAAHARSLPGPTNVKKTVPVKDYTRQIQGFKPTGPTPEIRQQEVQDNKAFYREQQGLERKTGKQGSLPTGPKLKGTQQERQQARKRVQQTKRVLKKARGSDGSVEGEVGSTLLNHGMNRIAAAGTIGNSKQEASPEMSTTITDASGQNGGLFGFTAEPVSLNNLKEYAASKGKDWTNPRVQTRFMLEHLDPGTKARMNAAASPQEAAVIFQNEFERPGEPMQSNREAFAAEAATSNAFGKSNPKAVANYKAAVKEAKELGLKVSPRGVNVGPPPKKVVTRFKAIKASANALEAMDVPYVYGGGHNGGMPDPSEGLDCSSSTVYLLNKAGVKTPNITSGEFGNYFPSGPGAVTIFYNPEHVFLKIGDKYFGTSVGDSGAGGLGYHGAPSESYLAQYNVAHVPGLGRKQALQLGFKPGSLTGASPSSFPGMSFSPSGTTATITEGTVTKGKQAKSSKLPIKVDPLKKAKQTLHQLKSLGAGVGQAAATEAEPTKASGLATLERKYGPAAV